MGDYQHLSLLAVFLRDAVPIDDRYANLSWIRQQLHGADALARAVVHSGLHRSASGFSVALRRNDAIVAHLSSYATRF